MTRKHVLFLVWFKIRGKTGFLRSVFQVQATVLFTLASLYPCVYIYRHTWIYESWVSFSLHKVSSSLISKSQKGLPEEKSEFTDSKGHISLPQSSTTGRKRSIFLVLSFNYPVAIRVSYLSFSIPTALK